MLTPREFAEQYHGDVTYAAVINWIRTKKLKAVRIESIRGHGYLIPATELKRFQQPRAGRPRKKAA